MKKAIFFSVILSFGFKMIPHESVPEVRIGSQTWAQQNLDVDTFQNGDIIPEATTAEEWISAGNNKQPACCYYEYDFASGSTYGRMYNWYAINDSRGLAPKGWHVPSIEEWNKLIDFLGGREAASSKLKSTWGWVANGEGTDDVGFTGLPGGACSYNGEHSSGGVSACWWTSSHNDGGGGAGAYCVIIEAGVSYIRKDVLNSEQMGQYLRCVKD